jgi:hypothetical protein
MSIPTPDGGEKPTLFREAINEIEACEYEYNSLPAKSV